MSHEVTISQARAEDRLVRRKDLVACEMAFIDCRIPGSDRKVNYSIIGPGVSESSDQFVHIQEPHGFSLGVAAMPPGVTNNLHIHYTSEVFIIFSGEWLFRWGADGEGGEIRGKVGDVVSIPTWVFRGFSNVGDDDGWIFTALGRDDCGGLIWHPDILRRSAELGVFLTLDDMVVDTNTGATKPDDADLVKPLTDRQLAMLDKYTLEDMTRRIVRSEDRKWSDRSLLCAMRPGCDAKLASVIGPGMTEDRGMRAAITNPHGFCIEWLSIGPNSEIGPFKVSRKQVMIVYEGRMDARLNREGEEVCLDIDSQDVFSAPADVWRSLKAGPDGALVAIISNGDGRTIIEWDDAIVSEASEAGFAIDPDGYIAPKELLLYLKHPIASAPEKGAV